MSAVLPVIPILWSQRRVGADDREALCMHVAGLPGTIPAIFTDEPQFTRKHNFTYADEPYDLAIPWTTDLLETYRRTYGQALEDYLPELFWELPGGQPSVVRYRYHDHVCERLAQAFVGTIAAWCDQHGLVLTGHVMDEPTLCSQVDLDGRRIQA